MVGLECWDPGRQLVWKLSHSQTSWSGSFLTLCRFSEGSTGQSLSSQALNPWLWDDLGCSSHSGQGGELQPLNHNIFGHSLRTGLHSCGPSLSPEPLRVKWERAVINALAQIQMRKSGDVWAQALGTSVFPPYCFHSTYKSDFHNEGAIFYAPSSILE